MHKSPENAPDDNASFLSVYKAISTSFDESNPYHQNLVRCLDFIVREKEVDKAEARIPEEIKNMICVAVQEILKELEPEPDPKLNPKADSERKRTRFSQRLEEEWLPNLPKFMAVVPTPKPKPQPVPAIKVQHEKTPSPLSPKESAISPKQPSENPSASVKQPDRRAPVPAKKQPDRPVSVPVKNKRKGFFSRTNRSKPQEETTEETRKNQSKSL